jgi:hypothetical protein
MRESDTTPGTYEFLCLATTIGFNRAKEFEDASTPDCDDPDAMIERRSIARMRSWGIKISGKLDAKRLEKLEADFNATVAKRYQLTTALTAAKGGKTYTGTAHLETLDINRAESALTTFEAALRGEGALTTAPVA